MIEIARFSLLLGATVFAAWRSWRHPHLFAYFVANLLYEICTEWPLARHGDGSAFYVRTYAVFTAFWLLSAAFIVLEAIRDYTFQLRRMAFFALVSLGITRFVQVGIHRQMALSDWIVLSEAGILYMLGFALACVSFFSGRRADIYFILAALWMCQAGFFWTWLLGLPEAAWIEAGWYVPTAFCVCAFTLVGLRLHPTENVPHHGGLSNRRPT